jgi:beta-lactam-binding protein with PASTA domain
VDFGSTVTLHVGASAETIPVPNVLGQTAAAARAAIEALDLVYVEGPVLLLDTGDPDIGKVADVSPAVGSPLDPGDTVTVRIGAEGSRVPDVARAACLHPDDARLAIEAAGLVYQEGPIDDTLPPGDPCNGKVVEQSPAPFSITSSLVARGTTVTVRLGQAMVTVPDVRAWILELLDPLNTDLDDSKAAIEAAGLRWQIEECQPIPAYSAYVGRVVDQDPLGDPPGTDARPPLFRVTLYVGVASGNACPHPPPP